MKETTTAITVNTTRSARTPVRIVATLCAMLITLCTLSGCGSFSIQGTWQSVGEGTWGQVIGKGATVTFDKTTCNLFSPRDTYLLEKNSDNTYKLTVTGLLGMGGTFTVTPDGNDRMTLKSGDIVLEFQRIE
ncbi:hypothetical protein JS532_01590 [Bifidobacterium callimiconis]|uniref:hypothetical protein n=1 Tax=Bifidobacterium callimiconis TaxID=2306973 RepID=UPI001BDDB51F|nr:hypothetical protein [Bifidobacterium callimiconis]MBT1176257.1 hypothetical protein [Bifidobacterium callimiconis]